MERQWRVHESLEVSASPERVYREVADVRNLGRWSPECRRVAVLGRHRAPLPAGARFLGFNRKGRRVWFTECRVTVSDPGREFAFRVTTFGLPVALWGYRFAAEGEGTRVTEYWHDLRTGRTARLAEWLGGVFTGTPAPDRHRANRAGMRTTLERLKASVEAGRR